MDINNDASNGVYGLTAEITRAIQESLDYENFESLSLLIDNLHHTELADFISMASNDIRTKLIDFISSTINSEVLKYIDFHLLPNVIQQLGYERSSQLVSELDIDDAVYILEVLDKDLQEIIISYLSDNKSSNIRELLSYPEGTAGRIMNPMIVKVMEHWSVEQTINFLRNNKKTPNEFFQIFVLNNQHIPIGSVTLSKLIKSPHNVSVGSITNTELKTVSAQLSEHDISFIFKQYSDITALPVVNRNGRILGVIEVTDIIEVVADDTEEDYLKLAGVNDSDIYQNFYQNALKRLPWLLVNLIGSLITANLINLFGVEIEQMVILASMMPIVASIGGNSGTQTVTVIVRALATKSIIETNTNRVILKEILISLANAAIISIIGGIFVYYFLDNRSLAIVFGTAIIFNFFVAGFLGSLIPVVLNRINIDPALASGIFLTTMTDIAGFCSFLLLARYFLM